MKIWDSRKNTEHSGWWVYEQESNNYNKTEKNIDYWDAMINASWIVFSTDSIKMHKNQHTRKEWDEKMKIQCLRCLYCQKE